jgi:hypothetical protein
MIKDNDIQRLQNVQGLHPHKHLSDYQNVAPLLRTCLLRIHLVAIEDQTNLHTFSV